MGIDNTAGHWGAVAKGLHWSIALLVFVQLALGFYADEQWEATVETLNMAAIEEVTALFHLHKSLGLVIGVLVIARLVWRVTHYVPPLSGEMPVQLRALAYGTHWALYVLLLTLVGSGLFVALGSPVGLDFFYLLHISQLYDLGEETREVAELIHGISVWSLAALVTLHIAAAAFHHFALKDDTMVKILPAFLGGRGGPMRPMED